MHARTGLWEPGAGNRPGPPGRYRTLECSGQFVIIQDSTPYTHWAITGFVLLRPAHNHREDLQPCLPKNPARHRGILYSSLAELPGDPVSAEVSALDTTQEQPTGYHPKTPDARSRLRRPSLTSERRDVLAEISGNSRVFSQPVCHRQLSSSHSPDRTTDQH